MFFDVTTKVDTASHCANRDVMNQDDVAVYTPEGAQILTLHPVNPLRRRQTMYRAITVSFEDDMTVTTETILIPASAKLVLVIEQ